AYPLAFLQTLPVQGDTSFLLSGNLEWEASANATGYDVYMDGNNPPTTLLVENTTLTSYNVTGLLPNTTYYWSVVASNTNASLEASNSPMQFRTANVPTMVSNLTATLRASSLITLEWQDSIENETGFRIYRSSNIEGPFEQTGVDLPVSSVAFTDTGLSPNKRYYYKVVAFNEPGEGIPTQLDALTLAETPPAPAILSAEYNAVQLVVNPDGNSPLTEFAIEVSDSAATYFVESDDVLGVTPAWKTEAGWGAVTGVSITGVQACAQYKIRVKARNENGEETTYSDSVVVTVPCFTATHDVAEGWNLVSLPMSVEENDKAVVFPSSTSNAFYYQAGYTEENNLQPGKGYWLKFDSGETFSRMGVPTFTDTISVHTGWNIIGSVSGSVPIGNITSIPPGLVTSQIFGYSGSYFSTSTIEPGQGYWVKAANDGELILSSVISYSSLSKIKIVLTSELPPPPPSGSTNTTIIPSEFALEQNYPNPFNPTTVIQYSVPGSQYVSLKIYNILGEEVATLVNEVQTSGFKSQVWDANGLPSGLYYYRLVAGDFVETKSMSLIK
ncbi:MAG: T9SS type A sorting domain-containing protein, partial [Bacteroidetes bacterium]